MAQSDRGLSRAKLAPRELYAKGNYYSLTRSAPFSRLVYPVPEPGGLGVHVTLDLAGQARFGPDVEWVERIDYAVDPNARAERFYAAIRRYWPGLPDGALAPGYAGIRPKTAGPGRAGARLRDPGTAEHGVPGLVHLFGIESPGLTSSLALAGHGAGGTTLRFSVLYRENTDDRPQRAASCSLALSEPRKRRPSGTCRRPTPTASSIPATSSRSSRT